MSCFHLLNKNITSKVSKKTYFIVELLTKMSIHDQRKQYWIWFNQFWLESIKLSPYSTHRERLNHCLTFLLNLQPDPLGSVIWIKLSMLNRIHAMFLFSFIVVLINCFHEDYDFLYFSIRCLTLPYMGSGIKRTSCTISL